MSERTESDVRAAGAGPSSTLITATFDYVDWLTLGHDVVPRQKAFSARSTFCEYLDRLDARFSEAIAAEKAVKFEEADSDQPALLDRQLHLVDRVEAFHEQVYATLSALILLLTYVAPASIKNAMPSRRLGKFLDFVNGLSSETSFTRSVAWLKLSRIFRTKYAVHPQQHALRDWLTVGCGDITAIVYFLPLFRNPTQEETEAYQRRLSRLGKESPPQGPWDPEFEPPVYYRSFYVAPPLQQVHEAVLTCVRRLLEICKENRPAVNADPKWDRYRPGTIESIIVEHAPHTDDGSDVVLSAKQFPTRAKVTYTAKERLVSDKRLHLLSLYERSLSSMIGISRLFETEFLFREEGREYWLPVQKQVDSCLRAELGAGDEVYVYFIWVGAIVDEGAPDWVFLVNEFQKVS